MTREEFVIELADKLPDYLRTDSTEAPLLALIADASTAWVEGGIGTPDYSDARVMMLALSAGADLYDQRSYVVRGNTGAAVRESTRRLMDDMLLQLKLGEPSA